MKRLKTLITVARERNIDVTTLGKYQIGDDSALSESCGTEPYFGQSKSDIVSKYLKEEFSDAFTSSRPPLNDLIIMDAEPKLFSPPKSVEDTFKDTIVFHFQSHFIPELNRCDYLCLIFDQRDFPNDISEGLKEATRVKRYIDEPTCVIEISHDSKVPSNWNMITKIPENRSKYKTLIGEIYKSSFITDYIKPGKHIYINGLYPDGETMIISNENGKIVITNDVVLKFTEADVKVYRFLEYHPEFTKPLIVNVDTDLIFIGLMHQSKCPNQECHLVTGMGPSRRIFWNLKRLVFCLKTRYEKSGVDDDEISKMMATLYAATGCDFNPFFRNITQKSIFKGNEEINSDNVLLNYDSFVKVIINAYEKKYKSVSFSEKASNSVDDVSRFRIDAFNAFDNEQLTCPLASVLNLQYLRAIQIVKYWNGEEVSMENLTRNVRKETVSWKYQISFFL